MTKQSAKATAAAVLALWESCCAPSGQAGGATTYGSKQATAWNGRIASQELQHIRCHTAAKAISLTEEKKTQQKITHRRKWV